MASPNDSDSIHTATPTPSLRSLPLSPAGKIDVDSHFRLPTSNPNLAIANANETDDHEPSSTLPPPSFSSLGFHERYFPAPSPADPFSALVTSAANAAVETALATSSEEEESEPAPPTFEESSSSSRNPTSGTSSVSTVLAETKAALPRDTKQRPRSASASGVGTSASGKELDDGEPPPPYTEGGSPLEGFTYVMAGAAGVITQVQQVSAVAPISTGGLGGELPSSSVWDCLGCKGCADLLCRCGRE